ncbi:MAG: STAS domain-containing protein [Candidatus Latescibacteria bacterium]|nr:STAS domain-containing protein [Candidatus Latescibacterota bacterium]
MSTLTAQVQHQGSIATIRLAGYLSSEAADTVEGAFQQAANAEKVLLVFQEKDFITSAGLAVVFDCVLPLQAQGRQVRIVHPSKHFRRVFDIVGLSKDVEIFAAEEQALAGW